MTAPDALKSRSRVRLRKHEQDELLRDLSQMDENGKRFCALLIRCALKKLRADVAGREAQSEGQAEMSDEPGDNEEAANFAEVKELGEPEVRRRLALNQLTLAHRESALRWVEEIDRRCKDAAMAEQMHIGRSSKNATWIAALAAIIAAIVAIVTWWQPQS